MLYRKMFRDIKHNAMQFITIFLLAFMAIFVYAGIASSNVGINQTRNNYHKITNLASAWVYGAEFEEEDLLKIKEIDHVTGAQLRSMLTTKGEGEKKPDIYLYMEKENLITKPYTVEGEPFDPTNPNGIWLNNRFAEETGVKVGDTYTLTYNNGVTDIEITKTIKGLIMSPEYEYYIADGDIEADFSKVGYAYMAYEEGNQIPMNQIVLTTDKKDVMSLEDKVREALNGNYAVMLDESGMSGITVLNDEMAQHEAFAFLFPLIFVIISILTIMTTMNRVITEQRIQIGTLKALGMKKRKILFHYLSYSFVLSLLGAIAGLIVGPLTLSPLFGDFMPSMYTLPEWKSGYSISFYMVCVIVVAACCLATYHSCRKLLKINPADTLRPVTPKTGKACIFEKLPFWEHLGFSNQYNLRDIARSKLRAFMCLFGTISGMMLLVAALGANDSISYVSDWQFDKLATYKNQILLNNTADSKKVDEFSEKNNGELIMSAGIEVSKNKENKRGDKETAAISVCEGKGIYKMMDAELKEQEFHDGEIALTKKLAEKLGVKAGDTVDWHLYEDEKWVTSKVTMINRNPQFVGMTMTRNTFEQTGHTFAATMCITNNETVVDKDNELVKSVFTMDDIKKAFDTSMASMIIIVVVLIIMAVLLTIIVLYNSGILSYNERQKELATLKVMGFRTGRIRRLLFKQNLWLSLIGVVIGIPLGKVLLQYMFDSNGDSFDFVAYISIPSYLISAILLLSVSTIVSIAFSRRLKKLDMVEVLKGLE
ncbi:MAG: FtsX-like permease family protein [bacterium]|nr:FtsX-like permease family protein [bacterium]